GSSALCQQLATITAQPGDEIIFPWRSFEAYPIFARIVGATPVAIPLAAEHRLDLPAMAAAITERTKLIFVCNPNNPPGTTITNA
ncbi:aminotransferase class I/II-fold pyridoxal phosphate-dependent enzyme, partial [Escherichia coli]|nr:aminotransferase class I/II-fold pyridoxal phosphate-dependent enzyme [Escherichia coli]